MQCRDKYHAIHQFDYHFALAPGVFYLFLVIDDAFSGLFLGSSRALVVGAQGEWYEIVSWGTAPFRVMAVVFRSKVLHILDKH